MTGKRGAAKTARVHRPVFRWLVTLLLITISMALARVPQAAAAPPNVLFLFTDDQRADTIRALGNPHIVTPNLDRLAERSFVFRNAYCFGGNTGAVCIPSRNMTMTGRTFLRFRPEDNEGRTPVYANPQWPNFPKSMKTAGYETYYREKSGSANLPTIRLDFEHRQDIHEVNALRTGRAARGIVDDAIRFLRQDRDRTRPFFMYLGFPCPHDPRWAARRFRDLYDPEKIPLPPNYLPIHPWDIGYMTIRDECLEAWPRSKKAIRRHLHDYYALISSMDYDIGRLLDTLDELKLTENTIIIFSSDQGIAIGSHGLMGKQNIYEDTMKVPLLFAGPGIPAGQSDAFAYLHDIYPTVCEMVGAEIPAGLDGKSLAPVIGGKVAGVRDRLMLAMDHSQRSIRDARWKLIVFPQINRHLLFDLKKDPHETQDLSARPQSAPLIKRLWRLLEEAQRRYGDTAPLKVAHPRPAKFIPPAKRPATRYPAGGLAPDER